MLKPVVWWFKWRFLQMYAIMHGACGQLLYLEIEAPHFLSWECLCSGRPVQHCDGDDNAEVDHTDVLVDNNEDIDHCAMAIWKQRLSCWQGKVPRKYYLLLPLPTWVNLFSVMRRYRINVSYSVSQWVTDSKNRVNWCDPGEWGYLLRTLLM